ncbi:MAG: PIG-L deacetylase family protein [Patescibacteria group bacterium]|jgi:LmbE family N-acetylglucosaminyl deacetylase
MIIENILVIAPHHDDEILGCGGFISKNIKQGNDVTILIVTNGWSGVKNKLDKSEKIRFRENECKAATEKLGVKKLIFLRKEDRTIYADQDLQKELTKIIQKINPSIVLAPHKDDSDFEHKLISNLVREAAWLAKGSVLFPDLSAAKNLKKLLFYEVWSPLHHPNNYFDITSEIEQKKDAMHQYASQQSRRDYIGAILGLNSFRGKLKGMEFAEAFEQINI